MDAVQLCFSFSSRKPAEKAGDAPNPASPSSIYPQTNFSQSELERRLIRILERAQQPIVGRRRSRLTHISEIGGDFEDSHEEKRAA